MHSCYESTINNMEWIKYPFIQEGANVVCLNAWSVPIQFVEVWNE